jgi:hypothetical protein
MESVSASEVFQNRFVILHIKSEGRLLVFPYSSQPLTSPLFIHYTPLSIIKNANLTVS